MSKRIGRQTVRLAEGVVILSAASTVGPKEAEGPLGKYFDQRAEDALFGEATWELAESKFVEKNMALTLQKANLKAKEVDYILCGDLLNQCTGSTFGVRQFEIPFFGLFGACSTMGEAMSLGAMLIDGGFANHVLAGASSHFCAAEKQFRFPLPLGTQRPPTATWTVTGDGAVVLARKGNGPKIVEITTGKIVDMGVTDANNMGAAMAPAAADLLQTHFADTGRTPQDYDVIATGDLGTVGRELVVELLAKAGYEMDSRYTDCGIEIFDNETQDTHAGGSGCACSAVTFCAYFYPKLLSGEIQRMLFIPTGALMSPTSSQQAVHPRHCAWACDRGLQKGGEEMTELLKAFLVGGLLCVIGQLLIDKTKLMSGRILVLYVCIGCILGGLGIYQKIEGFGGAGETVPLTGFGFRLAEGVMKEVEHAGILGIFTGGIKSAAAGITAAIFFAFFAALFANPKEK